MGSRDTSSIKSALPKFNGSGVEFPLWKRRFEGFALANDCMRAFMTAIDMPVGNPSVTSRFLLDQCFSEASVKRASIAWTCLPESIIDRALLSRVFDTNSSSKCRLAYVVRLVVAETPLREVETETPIQRTGHGEEGRTD